MRDRLPVVADRYSKVSQPGDKLPRISLGRRGINMRKIAGLWAALMFTLAVSLSIAVADQIDTFLEQIKDSSADVRVKAIEELCAG
jgi:hypothetical protein